MPPLMNKGIALTDAIIFTGEAFVEGHALLLEGGTIKDLCPAAKCPSDFETFSFPHHILSPGFIDCQVNGGGNVLFNNTPTIQGALEISKAHRKTGTTSLLVTCITDKPEVTEAALSAAREAGSIDSGILGLHLEGPHISAVKHGTHNKAFIRPMDQSDLAHYRPTGKEIILLTLAPEIVPPEYIRTLTEQGVKVSLGHSEATAAQTYAALEARASCFTHLYTRMPPMTSREPGLTGVALDNKTAWAGIICDNEHLAPELVRIAVRAKAADKLFMVSDAAAPAGAKTPLPFDWAGIKVFPQGRKLINENGALAGALMTLGECVPIAIKDIGLDPERVLRMASTIPAEFLGLGKKLGKLLPGYQADIVALNHSFKTESVWKHGQRAEV